MAGKKGGDNSKKAAGQARKADAAAGKKAAEDAKKAAVEDTEWQKGAKGAGKKEAEAEKKAEKARQKALKDQMLAEEEQNTPGRSAPKNAKTATKKTNRGLDLSQLDSDDTKLESISARNIDDGIAALSLDAKSDDKVDRHPERRLNAVFTAYKQRRLQEMKDDGSGKGLRLAQREEQIWKEFKTSPENPFNQAHIQHNATQDERKALQDQLRATTEARLTTK
ncbi:DUF1014-domain-containing protein [Xylariaceae sp. FL0804]|nr:DUF1014-domain-containing protein [Xylariaceae sp. FL0804]